MHVIGPDGRLPVKGFVLETPEATLLEEYTLIVVELQTALRALKTLSNLLHPVEDINSHDRVITTALYRDFILRLTGCFDPKLQVRLDRGAVYADSAQLSLFDELVDLRDTYVAHHFGAGRLCYVTIVPDPVRGGFVVKSDWFEYGFKGRELLPLYGKLIRTALTAARRLAADSEALVAAQARALGINGIMKLPPVEAIIPRDAGMAASRRQHRVAPGAPPPRQRGSKGRRR